MLGESYKEFLAKFEPVFVKTLAELKESSVEVSMGETTLESFFSPLIDYTKGGKRIRPYLISVAAGSTDKRVIQAGVAFEILHTFILIHDDIMDGAKLRRGVPTAHVAFERYTPHGKWAAMLLGDFLLASASDHMSRHSRELLDEFHEMLRLLILGQYFEMLHWGKEVDAGVSENIEYFKSAQYTFMYPLRMGLILTDKKKGILDEYAKYTGLAFQMRDDWLDVTGEESGKDKGLDAQNSVPNVVQQLMKENKGDIQRTKIEVERKLDDYREKALIGIEGISLLPSQKEALGKILEFCVSV